MKIEDVTPEQWALIDAKKAEWIGYQTTQQPIEMIQGVVAEVYKGMGHDAPIVHMAPSPLAAIQMDATFCRFWDEKNKNKGPLTKTELESSRNQVYWSVWWSTWAAWYEGAKILGVSFDEEKLQLFSTWCKCVPCCIPREEWCVVSANPVEVHWQGEELHCETGPAVRFMDGFSYWCLENIRVDEKIVMRPHEQTIEEINAEDNADVRSIRIKRFGWTRYIAETDSACVEYRDNDLEGTKEALIRTPKGDQRLVVTCPTGRVFAMGVPSDVKSCEEAQVWLAGEKPFRVIART